MKKNEQGQWQRRFICIVPHMFLYYYDIDNGESPRGIIDLYYYNHAINDGNILTIGDYKDGGGPRFFFYYFILFLKKYFIL